MIRFKRLHCKKHLVFENLTWEIDKYPLSVIRGEDRDAKYTTSNGVGKSALASTLTTLLTDAPPIAIKKKSAKDFVKDKAEINLDVRNNKIEYAIQQYAKAKSVKYNITVDGVAQEIKDIKVARELIAKAAPLSEDHVFSRLYISSYRPSILLYGSASSRLAFFENIFDLRIYDQLRKMVVTKLQKVNQDFVKSRVLLEQKANLEPALKSNVQKRLKKLQLSYAEALTEHSRAHKAAQKLTAYVSIAEQLHSEKTIKLLQKEIKICQEKVTEASDLLESLREKDTLFKSVKITLQKRQTIQKELNKLSYLDVGSKLAKLQRKHQLMSDDLKTYLRYESHIDKYRKLHKKYSKVNFAEPESLKTKLDQLNYELKQQRVLHDKKLCPLCKQPVTKKHKHRFAQLKEKIKSSTILLTKAKTKQYLQKIQSKVPLNILQLDKNEQHILLDKLKHNISYLTNQVEINDRYDTLKEKLDNLPKVSKTTKKSNPVKMANLVKIIDKNKQLLFKYKNDQKLLEKLQEIDLNPASLKDAQRNLLHEQNVVSKLTPMLQEIGEQIQELTKIDADYISASRQITKIAAQLDELNDSIKNRDVLEALSKAYSNKGIRLIQIESLAEAYIGTLNMHSSSLYARPIKFISNIEPGKCDIIAERGTYGDVRSLSGAESRQFLALSALGLTSLMPSNLRSNLLILDEIEAGLSAVNRKKFSNEFIPLLQQYVENLVIITPHMGNDFFIPNAKELTLVRENGFTSWKE